MLNFQRYTRLYWFVHQWNSNTKVTYSFHTFYRRLNLLSSTHQFSISQLSQLEVVLNYKKQLDSPTRRRSIFILQEYTQFEPGLVFTTKTPTYNSTSCWYEPKVTDKIVDRSIGSKKYLKFDAQVTEFDYSHRAWIVGQKKLSFYIKKTITYEKNRKVKKAKLFLQFSKLYNFFKNMVNVFFKQDKLSKKYVYMYFLKKQYKLSVYNIFKGLAQKLTNQKKKPLILNVPHRK